MLPVPVRKIDPVPETTPDSVTVPLPLKLTALASVLSVPVRDRSELVLFWTMIELSAWRFELIVWTAVPLTCVTTMPDVPLTPSLLNSKLPLLSV